MMMKNEKGYVNKGIDWLIDQDGEEQGAYAPPPADFLRHKYDPFQTALFHLLLIHNDLKNKIRRNAILI